MALRRLLAGTGKDQTHLLVIATAERGLCGGFNSSIVRLAREHAERLLAQGKTVKIMTVGKKGNDVLKRDLRPLHRRCGRFPRPEAAGILQRAADGRQDHQPVQCRRIRCLHAVLRGIQVGDRRRSRRRCS